MPPLRGASSGTDCKPAVSSFEKKAGLPRCAFSPPQQGKYFPQNSGRKKHFLPGCGKDRSPLFSRKFFFPLSVSFSLWEAIRNILFPFLKTDHPLFNGNPASLSKSVNPLPLFLSPSEVAPGLPIPSLNRIRTALFKKGGSTLFPVEANSSFLPSPLYLKG